jgi:uncharacterized protein YjiS (DUF1127 family)
MSALLFRRLALPTMAFRRIIATLGARASLARSRRALARLDDRLLADAGLSPAQARAEAARPGWDVPPHWRA